jgi:hypothetical protein
MALRETADTFDFQHTYPRHFTALTIAGKYTHNTRSIQILKPPRLRILFQACGLFSWCNETSSRWLSNRLWARANVEAENVLYELIRLAPLTKAGACDEPATELRAGKQSPSAAPCSLIT